MYSELRTLILSDEETDVQSLTDEQVNSIRTTYPGIPKEYLVYLSEIGCGTIAMSFVIYNGPKPFSEVYPQSVCAESVILIGDNMSGKCMGYDNSSWDIVEVLPGGTVRPLNTTFELAIDHVCKELFDDIDG